jgi:hypothetical protein
MDRCQKVFSFMTTICLAPKIKNLLMRPFFLLTMMLWGLLAGAQDLPKINLPDSVTVSQENAPFRKSPENTSEIIFRVKSKTKAALIGVSNDYLKVRIDSIVGFISYVFIEPRSVELKNYFNEYANYKRKKEESVKDSISKEIFRQEQLLKNDEFQATLARLTKKYGSEIGKKLSFGNIWIGMSREMLIESKGQPLEINRTVTLSVINEQFVYPNQKYVYLENGKVKAWQDRF